MKLKVNTANAILSIINCILYATSWFVVLGTAVNDAVTGGSTTSGASVLYYGFAIVGLVLSIVALIQSKKANISIVGPLLCLIGNACFTITALLAFPAIVLLIIGCVFSFIQKPVKINN